MPFDLIAHMNAMTRVVRNLERDGKPAKAVVASFVYDTDAADLWDALTSKKRLPRWFAPVSGDLKLGGKYQVQGNASGTITECVPNKKIAATWEFGGGVTWITVTLRPKDTGTELELEHVAHEDPRFAQFGPGAVGVGWDLGFLGMARHLENPAAARPPEGDESWYMSDEAKTFIRGSSDAWGEASIKSGIERTAALEAAENTRKFFTGEMPPPQM
jgi:uncharacterized protein YndB with AHSA1/START domain